MQATKLIKKNTERSKNIAGLVIDILFVHYNGITCLDERRVKGLRQAYKNKTKLLEQLQPSNDVVAMISWGHRENIVRAYRFARYGNNTALAQKLTKVINTLPAIDKKQVYAMLGGLELPLAKKETPILICNCSVECNKQINKKLESELGGGHYRLLPCHGIYVTKLSFLSRVWEFFKDSLKRLVDLFKIKHFAEDKLKELQLVCDARVDNIYYNRNSNELVVGMLLGGVRSAGVELLVVREAVRFLQNMHSSAQDIRLVSAMDELALRHGEIPTKAAVVDVLRDAIAEIIAMALGRQNLDSLSEYRSVSIMSKLVSYLRRRRGMSVDGATRLCLRVGMGWVGNEPVVNRFVCFLKDFVCLSYDKAIEELFRTEACRLSDDLDREFVLNLLDSAMGNTILDADPFTISREDFKEHLLHDMDASIRCHLNDFVASYHEYRQNETNPARVLAYMILNLGDETAAEAFIAHKSWVAKILDNKSAKSSKRHLWELGNAPLTTICDYIEGDIAGEYEERRKKLNRFRRGAIQKYNKRSVASLAREMYDTTDTPAAKRWNGLVKAVEAEARDRYGLLQMSTILTRLKTDAIAFNLVECEAGIGLVDLVGRYVVKDGLMAWTRDKKVAASSVRNYLGTAIMGLMYSLPFVLKKVPEIKLGLFLNIYFGIEQDLGDISAENVKN